MRARAPWAGRTLLDLGCGSGYWLSGYADEAAAVIGVEPDPRLLPLAAGRDSRVTVLRGSAEHIPLPPVSVDVVHARFAYFFPPGCDAGLAEVMRVLRPGGTLVFVGNDLRAGEFAGLLRAATGALVPGGGAETDDWWAARGADRTTVRSGWRFTSRADFEAVLRMEFPLKVADPWLAVHPAATGLSYSYALGTPSTSRTGCCAPGDAGAGRHALAHGQREPPSAPIIPGSIMGEWTTHKHSRSRCAGGSRRDAARADRACGRSCCRTWGCWPPGPTRAGGTRRRRGSPGGSMTRTTSPPSSSRTPASVWSAARPECATGTPRGPGNPGGVQGLVFNMSTDPRYRRRGYARACLDALLAWFRDETEAKVIDLNATSDGTALYREVGFTEPRYPALQLRLARPGS